MELRGAIKLSEDADFNRIFVGTFAVHKELNGRYPIPFREFLAGRPDLRDIRVGLVLINAGITSWNGRTIRDLEAATDRVDPDLFGAYIDALAAIPYDEYLTTDEWHDVRSVAHALARSACQLCAGKRSLHVHHRSYTNRGWELPQDVVVLCKQCHTKFHSKDGS